jgi:hypothetical protein
MIKTAIESEIGFSDATILSYTKTSTEFIVLIRTWNERLLRVIFEEPIGIADMGGDEISELNLLAKKSVFAQLCISRHYDGSGDQGEFKNYQFIDNNDQPCLEVLAKKVRIQVE